MRIIIILAFFAIVFSLGSALFYLMRDQGQGKRTVNALTWRIGLSVLLFLLILLAHWAGWIQPTGIR